MYLTAVMLPFSLAGTNLFKAFMVLFAAVTLGMGWVWRERVAGFAQLRTPAMVAIALVVLALSLLYTVAAPNEALRALNKHGKLLLIPLSLVLLRQRREALIALACYIGAQTFVVLCSFLLNAGLELPWVFKPLSIRLAVAPDSSYLDQSIMTAGLAALAWHLRNDFPGRHGPRLAIALAALCAVNVLLLLPARSAQVALLAAMAMALFWAVPVRGRPLALLAPMLLAAGVMAASPHFRDRVNAVVTEVAAYRQGDRAPTSSGIRLELWRVSVQAIAQRPLTGFGIGSWNAVYQRLAGSGVNPNLVRLRNPHQEYLLWGVQLGLGGIALLLASGLVLLRDAARFRPDVRHATGSLLAICAVVCLFNSALFDALIGDYFCLLLGLLLALGLYTPAREVAA